MFHVVRAPAPDSPLPAPGAAARLERARRRGEPLAARYDFSRILGRSAALQAALERARVASRNDLPLVLVGESGTGKELFAHAVHAAGARCGGPFVAVNCGSIPAQLVEAELFGYEAGTFTGGSRDGKPGRFEDADGGTLFLDEVSELSLQAQTALLRVLQEREVVRVGGSGARAVDVRVVAATNKPLEAEVQARRFRRDLYYRINVLSISIPPLRERADDVVLLAEGFLAEAEGELGRSGLRLSEGARAALRTHRWPGNVRELHNVVLRSAAMAPGPCLAAADVLLDDSPSVEAPAPPPDEGHQGFQEAIVDPLRDVLLRSLEECRWNVARAAKQLGVSRMTLYRRLRRSGISRGRRRGAEPAP